MDRSSDHLILKEFDEKYLSSYWDLRQIWTHFRIFIAVQEKQLRYWDLVFFSFCGMVIFSSFYSCGKSCVPWVDVLLKLTAECSCSHSPWTDRSGEHICTKSRCCTWRGNPTKSWNPSAARVQCQQNQQDPSKQGLCPFRYTLIVVTRRRNEHRRQTDRLL